MKEKPTTQGEKMKTVTDDFKARGIGVTIRGKRGKAKSHENPLNYNIVRRMLTNRKHIGEYKFKDIVNVKKTVVLIATVFCL